MVKKLKKYVKFIVCMTLIMGLIAPSYAALSASDGSAFVTKAEFDSALADFNARLTTFEAGINSKIDSQVTSYLDRNGIWSGKDQEVFDCYGLLFGTRLNESGGTIVTANCGDLIYNYVYDTTYTEETATKGSQPTMKLINEINKSGLMCLTYDYSYNYGPHQGTLWLKSKTIWTLDNFKKMMRGEQLPKYTKDGYIWADNAGGYIYAYDNWTCVATQSIAYEQDPNVPLATEVYLFEGKKEATYGTHYAYTAIHPTAPKIYYFFVDKGKPLYLRYWFTVNDFSAACYDNVSNDRAMWQALTNIKATVY